MDQENFEREIRDEFILEAKEMLEETESAFIELEKNPGDKSILDKIFRLAHTVKGSGFAAGFNQLAEYAHIFETLLGQLRTGNLEVTSKVIDTLLKGNDTLRRYVELVEEDHQGVLDTAAVSAEIRSYLNEDEPKTESNGKEPAADTGSMGGLHLFADDEPGDKPPPAAPAESVGPDIGGGAVLIVDDEPQVLEILEIHLESFGRPVLKATNGVEALEVLARNKVELILSDVKMPKMTGIEFIEKVREFDKNIPVIFVSGAAERDDIVKFVDLGAYAFLEKPFDENQILVTSRNALSMKMIRDAIVRLSSLNFKAYVSSLRISKMGEKTDPGTRDEARKGLENLLDEIAGLTNTILAPGFEKKLNKVG